MKLAEEFEAHLKKCRIARGQLVHGHGPPDGLAAARADLENWLTSEGNGQRILDALRGEPPQ